MGQRLRPATGTLDPVPAALALPPDIPPVDVDGYRPATSVCHRDPMQGMWWHGPGEPCETCDATP